MTDKPTVWYSVYTIISHGFMALVFINGAMAYKDPIDVAWIALVSLSLICLSESLIGGLRLWRAVIIKLQERLDIPL